MNVTHIGWYCLLHTTDKCSSGGYHNPLSQVLVLVLCSSWYMNHTESSLYGTLLLHNCTIGNIATAVNSNFFLSQTKVKLWKRQCTHITQLIILLFTSICDSIVLKSTRDIKEKCSDCINLYLLVLWRFKQLDDSFTLSFDTSIKSIVADFNESKSDA